VLVFLVAKSMPLNPLSIFYNVLDRWQLHPSGYVDISYKCDPGAIRTIGKSGNLDFAGISLVNIDLVNTYFDRLLITDPNSLPIIVDNLYRIALTQPASIGDNCWFNFIGAMTTKVALHTWKKIPQPQQREELFEQLIAPSLSVESLLAGFNPQYQSNLLVGLQAWTYTVVRNNSFANLRTSGNPYFGLSNFGIVTRSSYKTIQMALLQQFAPSEVESYVSICKVFKTYLSRSKVSTDRLELSNWEDILVEVRARSIMTTVEELRDRIELIGSLIRKYDSPTIQTYDDANRSISIDNDCNFASLDPEIEGSTWGLPELFVIIDRFIDSLSAESRQIIQLRHHQQLKHKDIAAIVARDQPYISKHLGKLYLKLLDSIHSQASHPDGGESQKNSQALKAVEELLSQYFDRD
jgi:hypothetical protein